MTIQFHGHGIGIILLMAIDAESMRKHCHAPHSGVLEKRSRGQLLKWNYDTLKEAVAKRDTVLS